MPNGAGNPNGAPGYAPDNLTLVIGVNNTVTWTNNDSAHHTVTSTKRPRGRVVRFGRHGSGSHVLIHFHRPRDLPIRLRLPLLDDRDDHRRRRALVGIILEAGSASLTSAHRQGEDAAEEQKSSASDIQTLKRRFVRFPVLRHRLTGAFCAAFKSVYQGPWTFSAITV